MSAAADAMKPASVDAGQGGAVGGVRWLLRCEGGVALIVALFAYANYGKGWAMFALCFLLPDLSLLGYALNRRMGAALYNAAHSYVGALCCLLSGLWLPSSSLLAAALIWIAHIGFDRALGYGLKYPSGFGHTHLGRIGGRRNTAGGTR